MYTETTCLMRAPAALIYSLAAATERWPRILPHYRWVRVVAEAMPPDQLRGQTGRPRLLHMGAWRGAVPVEWWAEQYNDLEACRIRFRHVGGLTRGMVVEWRLEPAAGEGTQVTIVHDLKLTWPLIGGVVANRIVGPGFVAYIAARTLRQIQLLAEAAAGRSAAVTAWPGEDLAAGRRSGG